MPCSQTTTFAVGRSSERGTAPLSCDSNPTPTLHQQTWRIRTTPKASTSEGSCLARFELRDRERSRLRSEQSTKADQAGGNNFDFPTLTFSSLNTNLQMTTQDTATEKCRPARTESTTDSSSKDNSENMSDISNLHGAFVNQSRLFCGV